ncbi:hypothetical protein SLA2020_282910 [Shorea laevis]
MSELLSTATGHCPEESRTCFCGLTCYIQTSTSKANRGRKYFGCPKFRDGSHCKFFVWADNSIDDRSRDLRSESTTKMMWLEGELAKKEARERRYLSIFFVLSCLCLSLALMLMRVIFT